MSRKPSQRVTGAINDMYAKMARAAAKQAVVLAGTSDGQFMADDVAAWAAEWATKAGGNSLRWGL